MTLMYIGECRSFKRRIHNELLHGRSSLPKFVKRRISVGTAPSRLLNESHKSTNDYQNEKNELGEIQESQHS